MRLHEALKIKKGLPPDSLHDMLFARKLLGVPEKVTTVTGYPCVLENSVGKPVVSYKISGNIVQNGTPSPENPVEVHGVGDLITEGEYSGKYVIPVVSKKQSGNSKTTYIYLDKPLYKGDYIIRDKSGGKVHRAWGVKVFDGTEKFAPHNTLKGWFQLADSTVYANKRAYCTHFSYRGNAISMNAGNFTTANTINNSGRYVFKMSDDTTLEEFKAFLASEYAKGTPVTVYYSLAKPTEETIELPEIPTFKGTTTIETATEIQPENIEITYKSRR